MGGRRTWRTTCAPAHLITREGDTHTAFGRRNVCTDRFVSRYLVDLVLPPPDTSCG